MFHDALVPFAERRIINMKKSMKIYKNCSRKTLYSLCWRSKLKSKESVYKILGSHMNTVVPFGGVEAI